MRTIIICIFAKDNRMRCYILFFVFHHFNSNRMIKKCILLFSAAILLALPSKAQFMSLGLNKDRYNVGIQFGQAGSKTDYHGFGLGMSFSVLGVYADFLISPPRYADDNHIKDELWQDDEAFTINFGYQIPIFSWLRIAPIIGYSQTNWGYVDASTINLEVQSDGQVSNHHDYEVVKRYHDFNFGGGIFIAPTEFLEIYGVYTVRSIYGGISFNLGWIADE